MRRALLIMALASAPIALLGCGNDNNSVPTSPGDGGQPTQQNTSATALREISPPPGAATVEVGAPIVLDFNGVMDTAQARFVDLHQGSIDGPIVPWTCTWGNADSTLTCTGTPAQPLLADTPYVLHIGAGLKGTNGEVLSSVPLAAWGGTPITATDMPSHGGQPSGGLAEGWKGTGDQANLLGWAYNLRFLPAGSLPDSTGPGTTGTNRTGG